MSTKQKQERRKDYEIDIPKCEHNQIRSFCKECQKLHSERGNAWLSKNYEAMIELTEILKDGKDFKSGAFWHSPETYDCLFNLPTGVLEISLKQ